YNGICYFISNDHCTWDQGQARCSELGASLAVLKDWEMMSEGLWGWKVDHWLGPHRWGQGLQWGDGSSFSSSAEILGNAECVHLADNKCGSTRCSSQLPYLCSKPQTCL
ncbi:CD69 protein, partial [Orthonyx spaldingii]|nr:CD69 protein [Orthonyx spaldingii]